MEFLIVDGWPKAHDGMGWRDEFESAADARSYARAHFDGPWRIAVVVDEEGDDDADA